MYTTTIRPRVTYATERVNLTKKEELQLSVFERKITRTMMEPKKNE